MIAKPESPPVQPNGDPFPREIRLTHARAAVIDRAEPAAREGRRRA